MDSLQFQVEVAGQDAVTNNLVPGLVAGTGPGDFSCVPPLLSKAICQHRHWHRIKCQRLQHQNGTVLNVAGSNNKATRSGLGPSGIPKPNFGRAFPLPHRTVLTKKSKAHVT